MTEPNLTPSAALSDEELDGLRSIVLARRHSNHEEVVSQYNAHLSPQIVLRLIAMARTRSVPEDQGALREALKCVRKEAGHGSARAPGALKRICNIVDGALSTPTRPEPSEAYEGCDLADLHNSRLARLTAALEGLLSAINGRVDLTGHTVPDAIATAFETLKDRA